MELLADHEAFASLAPGDIEQLTRAATDATFYGAPLTDDQVAANQRIVAISTATCEAAALSDNQHFVAALIDARLAGYVIATRHSSESLELDWLMVHPEFHGAPVSRALMDTGIDWLGRDQPVWLTVIQHNARAIRFYEKFGFTVDVDARTAHVVPHYIMRRPAA